MREKGLTLIELLVVVAVIGLLASIVWVFLEPARGRNRDAQRIQNLKQLSKALELYYTNNESYPAMSCIESPWWNCWGNTDDWDCGTYPNALECMLSQYIIRLPRDPSFYDAGNICSEVKESHTLSYYSDGNAFFLCAYLEERQPPGYTTPAPRTTGCASYCNYFIGDWSPLPPL